jgi:hypothetical protein
VGGAPEQIVRTSVRCLRKGNKELKRGGDEGRSYGFELVSAGMKKDERGAEDTLE